MKKKKHSLVKFGVGIALLLTVAMSGAWYLFRIDFFSILPFIDREHKSNATVEIYTESWQTFDDANFEYSIKYDENIWDEIDKSDPEDIFFQNGIKLHRIYGEPPISMTIWVEKNDSAIQDTMEYAYKISGKQEGEVYTCPNGYRATRYQSPDKNWTDISSYHDLIIMPSVNDERVAVLNLQIENGLDENGAKMLFNSNQKKLLDYTVQSYSDSICYFEFKEAKLSKSEN